MTAQFALTKPVADAPASHRQGSLDGLCGIYSIINALTLLLGEERFDAKALFRVLLRSLSGSVVNAATTGMHACELTRLIRAAQAHLAKSGTTIAFRCAYKDNPDTLGEFWSAMRAHHETNGDGSILLGIAGLYDHWTCVRSLDQTRLLLADSGDLDSIKRAEATIGRATKTRPIIVQPMNTFLLWTTNIAPRKRRSVRTRQAKDAPAKVRTSR